jgi:hypothetical protein
LQKEFDELINQENAASATGPEKKLSVKERFQLKKREEKEKSKAEEKVNDLDYWNEIRIKAGLKPLK